MTLMWRFKVTKGQIDYAILFATYELIFVLYSDQIVISHMHPVYQQLTLIWLFKVTKGQTDYSIWSATHDFPITVL